MVKPRAPVSFLITAHVLRHTYYGTRTAGSKQLGPSTALASQRKEPRFLHPQEERDKFEIYDDDDDQNSKDGADDDNNDDDDG